MRTNEKLRQVMMRYRYTIEYIAVVVTLLLALQVAEAVKSW